MQHILEALRKALPHEEIPDDPKAVLRWLDRQATDLEDSGLNSEHDSEKWSIVTRAYVQLREALTTEALEAEVMACGSVDGRDVCAATKRAFFGILRGVEGKPLHKHTSTFLQRVKPLVDRWNTPPYPTLQCLADEMGITRQAVADLLRRASAFGCQVMDGKERLRLRNEVSTELKAIRRRNAHEARPRCSVCGKQMNRNAKQHADGKYYCAKHQLCDPVARTRQRAQSIAAAKRRLQSSPEYKERYNAYQREYYHRRKASLVGQGKPADHNG